MRNSKAIILVQDYGTDVRFLVALGCVEGLGQREWDFVEGRNSVMRKTQGWIDEQLQDVEAAGEIEIRHCTYSRVLPILCAAMYAVRLRQ